MNISDVNIYASFLAGLLAFFSPCVLPLLPVYISIFAGSSASSSEKHSLIVANTFAFILGFSAVFATLGLSVTAISQYLLFNKPLVVKVAGIFVIVLGLFLLGFLNVPFLLKERRKHLQPKAINPLSAFILGCTFALGWTPCIGPVLSSVLLMAGSTQSFKYGFLMLLVFSFGLALPFFIIALAADRAKELIIKTKKIAPYSQKAAGILLVIMGILLYLNRI
ncbi:sulfite exporter TauE/SafE family protein [Tepidanaerobacter sp. GT38]|uniref:cytochrome c biogenesis CcdA family protein n=1 Tax=Tepidanaerobacter sp. GT38 TaxID=2722793 RepID=UPI001F294A90|nr:cytochrome c biogenesis protein CcdA [Tepidanaerobacter sp. GT38]MCG1012336.1 sulfite exporter TauE/SafE family protein [Tepidanaerobacter sp. GT38]